MKLKLKYFSLFFLITIIIQAQEFKLVKEIGNFTEAKSFSYISSGYFILSDTFNNEIYKVDTTGKVINEIGGYGWQGGLFDNPTDVFSTELTSYVCDKNNDRIILLDRDLNYISAFYYNDNSEGRFKQPSCFALNNQGNYLVLDSYNQRILMFDFNGNYLQQIGGIDAGDFMLTNPYKFAISADGKIFVVNENQLFVFDQFGTGLIQISLPFEKAKIKIFNNYVTISNKNTIYTLNLAEINSTFIKANLDINKNIEEALFTGEKLYILTSNSIIIYD